MAKYYTDAKTYPKFGHFIRAVIGLPFAPLERLEEAMVIISRIAKANTGSRERFCNHMIKYLRKTWLDGSIPREVWNMYRHPGVTTNNHAEVVFLKIGFLFHTVSIFVGLQQ
jgi:hypothetical protein